MSLLETLRAAPSSPAAMWNTFIIEYQPNGKNIFVVHEGRDDPSFYRHHMESRVPAGWELRFIPCGTKKDVLKRSKDFADRYRESPRVLFFVDRDHDELIGVNQKRPYRWTYTTSGYSIENHVCSRQVVRAFLTDIAGLPDMDEASQTIEEIYGKSKEKLHEIGMPVMAWIIASRRAGRQLNLNNIDTKKLFKLNADLSPELVDEIPALFAYLDKVAGGCDHRLSPDDPEILREIAHLKTLPSDTWFRGKQDIHFLVMFLRKVVELLKPQKRVRPCIDLGRANALQILGPKAPLSACLERFLHAAAHGLSASTSSATAI